MTPFINTSSISDGVPGQNLGRAPASELCRGGNE